jgi:hypothetical protein
MLQGCCRDVAGVLQGCYRGGTGVVQRWYRGGTGVVQGCYRGATGVLHTASSLFASPNKLMLMFHYITLCE